MANLAAIETEIVNRLDALSGINSALDHEPKNLGKLPCATLLLTRAAQEEVFTGPLTEVTWEWRVTLYVQLSDFKSAQDQLKALMVPVLTILHADHQLGGLVERSWITDDGEAPIFDVEAGVLMKFFSLSAITTED